MKIGWDWPGPYDRKCGVSTTDRATDRYIYCQLRKGHRDPHHWEHLEGGQLLSASWIGDPLYIGSEAA